MDGNNNPNESRSERRKFNKLCDRLRKQMEFYFSDSNLSKDKFLSELIAKDPDGYVDLEVFKSFNKIKSLTAGCDTDTCSLIATSVGRSKLFEVSEDRTRLKRTTPIDIKDFDACTLYVEKLPHHADQKWIQDIFRHFGAIKHVNVPRYRVTNKIKGFAFIEFENPDSVKNACMFYKSASEKECSASEDESKNVKNVKKNKAEEVIEKKSKKNRTRSISESSEKIDCLSSKSDPETSGKDIDQDDVHQTIKRKRKREDSESGGRIKKLTESADEDPCSSIVKLEEVPTAQNDVKTEDSTFQPKASESFKEEKIECLSSKSDPETSGKNIDQDDVHQTIKRKRKREDSESGSRIKKLKESADEDPCSSIVKSEEVPKAQNDIKTEDSTFQPKASDSFNEEKVHDSDMNGSEMEEGKNKRKRKKKHRMNVERPPLRVMPKSEWKTYRNQYLELQRTTMKYIKKQIMLETQELKEQESHVKVLDVSEPKKSLQFIPDVIVKVTLSNPVKNSAEIKDLVKVNAVVAYIDAPVESTEIFIRCHNPDEALTIVKEEKLSQLGKAELLKGEEEKLYWEKIENDRKAKFSVPAIHKKRGRDKLLAKAAKLEEMKNKHIYFED